MEEIRVIVEGTNITIIYPDGRETVYKCETEEKKTELLIFIKEELGLNFVENQGNIKN